MINNERIAPVNRSLFTDNRKLPGTGKRLPGENAAKKKESSLSSAG
jgi:hypothetical protein